MNSEDAAKQEARLKRIAHALACLADAAKDVRPDGIGYLGLHGMRERFREVIDEAIKMESPDGHAERREDFVTVPLDKLNLVLGYFRAANWPDTRVGNAAYTLNDFVYRQLTAPR